jgi:hypothetical protein
MGTRPDICFATAVQSRFMHRPAIRHEQYVLRLMQYVSCRTESGLMFSYGDLNGKELQIACYADADLGRPELNKESLTTKPDCCLTTGYIICLNQSPVQYCSSKQHQTSRSLTQADLLASCECLNDLALVIETVKQIVGNTNKQIKAILNVDNENTVRSLATGFLRHRT